MATCAFAESSDEDIVGDAVESEVSEPVSCNRLGPRHQANFVGQKAVLHDGICGPIRNGLLSECPSNQWCVFQNEWDEDDDSEMEVAQDEGSDDDSDGEKMEEGEEVDSDSDSGAT